MLIESLGQLIFQAFVGNGAYDLATLSAGEVFNKLKEIVSSKNIENISDKSLKSIANNISSCIESIKKEIEKENNSNLSYEECYKKVIIESFENIENSNIKVGGDEKYIDKSFKNIKNTTIDV